LQIFINYDNVETACGCLFLNAGVSFLNAGVSFYISETADFN